MSDDVCLCPFAGEDDPCPCARGNHAGCPRCPSVDRSVSAVGPTREDKERECICPPATSTTVAEHGYASGGASTRYGCPKHTYEVRNEAVGPTT